MEITKEHLGRLSASSIIAVLGFIALHNSCGLIPDVIIWWLLYTVGCGIVLNTTTGERPGMLLKLALLPALIPVFMVVFFKIAGLNLCLSLPGAAIILMLPLVSWFAIFMFSFAKLPLSAFTGWIIKKDGESKVNKIVGAIQLIIGGIVAVSLALSALGK